MPQVEDNVVQQVELERAEVAAVVALFDERLADTRARLVGTLAEQADGATEAYERDLAAEQLAREVRRLEGAEGGLVFGRIDLADGTALRIGRLSLQRDEDELPALVDWRADAARAFYEATPVHPMGLRRRRHLRLTERTVVGVSDELLDGSEPTAEDVVGDGPLAAALQARRTGRMGTAVATLQTEQDAIVRSQHRGVTVVQGGPGTGKTVVALHRAAYVLYAFPKAAERGVLVLGPNARFLDYISHVLPSLGESEVVLATCAELAAPGLRNGTGGRENGAGTGRAPDGAGPVPAVERPEAARLKGDGALAGALAATVRERQAPAGEFAVRVGQDDVCLGEAEVARTRDAALMSGLPHHRARGLFKELLVDAVTRDLAREAAETLERIDAEVAELTGLDLDRATASDLRNLGIEADPAAGGAEFDADAMRAALLDDDLVERTVEELWPHLTPGAVVDALLGDLGTLAARLPGFTAEERQVLLRAPGAPWTDADLPLLDEASALLDGPPARTFGHVVVDEAQEFTALQWRMVLRRCPARSMTLVGDFAQAGPATTAHGWHEALDPHLGGRFDLRTLTVSYRTTEEILATTRELLARIAPDQAPIGSIRHGEEPRSRDASPAGLMDALLAELREQSAAHPGELIGVVCPDGSVDALTAAGAERYARLVPASEARGLEFDTAVVLDPDAIASARPGGERDLYVALTRATKRLCTIVVRKD
ncbi:HelD family protein [Kitasatospora purpeofusca]|uniref:HelD family protein n=1 Tax=Kitasatospora purpeofusca TaxID=67352 RepID=UPI002A59E8E6|nr:AAA family ATPase [Kitasatospora purpeofusca]MDY0812230.1 AAA family ATPase [Kitasatospora purpeofusca]